MSLGVMTVKHLPVSSIDIANGYVWVADTKENPFITGSPGDIYCLSPQLTPQGISIKHSYQYALIRLMLCLR
jgi:hypothetical protein